MSLNLTMLRRVDSEYLCYAKSSDITTIDGRGMSIALRLIGLGEYPQVAISDLSERLLELACERQIPVYLLGSTEHGNAAAVATVLTRFNGVEAYGSHGYYNESERASVVAAVARCSPGIVFVGMPSPKKERVIQQLSSVLPSAVLVACGGYLDILARVTKRAPRWVRSLGLEWLYRFVQEPKAKFRLMLVDGLLGLLLYMPAMWYFSHTRATIDFARMFRAIRWLPRGLWPDSGR